ncbi:MAG TPA: DUF3592 domain-containing protein, partial [Terriglobia bacterium]|nr:DUF3592 domain-containing protein [Terriglobia bacterium]
RDGRKYYVEGSVSSSVPLHALGQEVTVLINPRDPERAVLQSGVSYALGFALAIMGLAGIGAFWMTFRFNIFSLVMAAVILAGLGMKIKGAWRQQPLSLEAWNAYKKATLSARVFTEDARDQISWAEALRVRSAVEAHLKASRFAVPVLFLIGFGLLFLGYHFYGKTEKFLQSADLATGTVVDLSRRDSGDGNDTYSAVVEYRDARGGNFKFVDPFSSSPPYYYAGQEVHVLYNREDPNQAQIDRGLVNYWLTALFSAMGSLLVLMGLHSARKRRIGIQKT